MCRAALLLLFLLGSSGSAAAAQMLRVAVATTAEESGLVSYLVDEFSKANQDVKIELSVTGAINALQLGRSGQVDAIITHHPASESLFIAEGHGISRTLIMSNGFAIIGPPEDPLGLATEREIVQILTKIVEAEPAFITQGAKSGTFQKLQELWDAAGITPDWIGYESSGSSSHATLLTAAEFGAYTFADMGTYLSLRPQLGDAIVPLVRDHASLRNYYSYIVVNPARHTRANRILAERFLDWLVSNPTQNLISQFGLSRFTVQLYEPAAHLDETLQAKRAAENLRVSQRFTAALFIVVLLLAILAIWAMASFRVSARLQARTKQSEQRFSLAVAGSQDGIWDWDIHGQNFFYSDRAAQVLGLPSENPYPDLTAMVRDATDDDTWSSIAAELLGHLSRSTATAFDLEFPLKGNKSAPKWARLKGQVLIGHQNSIIRISGSVSDTTKVHRHEEEMRTRSITDELTGLPNRGALMPYVESALRSVSDIQTQAALFVLDLDGFKRINDTLGHNVGDELIKEIARRLRATMRENDFVARLGGDEFAVFVQLNNETQARHAGHKMHLALHCPIEVGGHVLNVDASIGAALYPDQGENAASLLRHAEVAMYQSKRLREPFSIYAPSADPNSLRSLRLENDLRTAIDDGSLCLYFQPKIHLPTRTLCGSEALLRWIHPQLGFIPPFELIPLAERTGLIRPLTRWIIDSALTQQADWECSGLRVAVAINLSIWDLEDPGLVRHVERCIREHDATPDCIEFEITESMMMTDPERTLATLSRLRNLGVRLSIDDFGTGFSSLAYLKRFPVTSLKIDKSFVQTISASEQDQAIVSSVVALAHSLGLDVVGEGVEDGACMSLLAELGCDIAQGFHIARPLPAADFAQWLAKSDFGYGMKPQAAIYEYKK